MSNTYDSLADNPNHNNDNNNINMTPFVSRKQLGMGGLGLQDLPHLDFAALYQELEMGAPDMADWNLVDSNQQVDVGLMAWQPSSQNS
jgi:hypothetical protein